MNKNQKAKIMAEINRCGNDKKLKVVLDDAYHDGYITEKWFIDAFEKHAKFIKATFLIDEMNQSIKEFNGETSTIVSPKHQTTVEAEPLHVDAETEESTSNEIDKRSYEEWDKIIKAIPPKERFFNKLHANVIAACSF